VAGRIQTLKRQMEGVNRVGSGDLGGVIVSQAQLEDFRSRYRTDKVQQAIQGD